MKREKPYQSETYRIMANFSAQQHHHPSSNKVASKFMAHRQSPGAHSQLSSHHHQQKHNNANAADSDSLVHSYLGQRLPAKFIGTGKNTTSSMIMMLQQ